MNHRKTLSAALVAALILCATSALAQQVTILFSPNGGCAAAICKELDNAKKTIRVNAYQLSHPGIALHLIAARQRGLDVIAVLDKKQGQSTISAANALAAAEIQTRLDGREKINHNKVIIIDTAVVITGSFNFSRAADTANAENLLIIHDPHVALLYTADWAKHYAHSEPLIPPATPFHPRTPAHAKDQTPWHVYQAP
jgi:phosphatidylserine/phosphatidylglycerophosphate/cardiolipin synthase-like enzyme